MAKDHLKSERMKILELVSKGVISVEDAEKLLNAMGDQDTIQNESVISAKKAPFRMLKILVDSNDGDQVRVELPIEFAKLLKSKRFNMGSLNDTDIDVDTLIEMINTGAVGEIVNIKSSDGDVVKIVVE
ncbi:MAG: hypothetical protein PHW40_00235 [Candidatus Izemoplasmatales bacterium]|jgi:hypothetical protein|nr:hypothetical protein [Candidatus Izemoplasmatales bacterium]